MTRVQRNTLIPLLILTMIMALAAYVRLAPPAFADTTSIQSDDVGWVQENQPTTGHCGSLTNVSNVAGNRQKSSFQFPVNLPAGSTITSATLRIYATTSWGASGTQLTAFDRDVTAADGCTIKWSTADWGGGGAYGAQLGQRVGSIAKNTYVSIPLTTNLSQVATTGRTGIVVTTNVSSGVLKFKTDLGTNKPFLDLTYSVTPTTTTTTTVAPTTTTTPPGDSPCVSALPAPEYGASSDVGPGREPRDTTGTQATTSNYTTVLAAAQPGEEVLLRAGTYGALNVPTGVTVKPYDCEEATSSTFDLHSGSTVAGFTVSSSAQWLDRITGPLTDIEIRNMRLLGATETLRVEGDVDGVTIIGSDIQGGTVNHAILIGVGGQPAPYPRNVLISNNFVAGTATGEDAVQFQASSAPSLVEHLSFGAVGEEFVDVKTPSTVTFQNLLLDNDGPNNNVNLTPGGGCALLTSADTVVLRHSLFQGGQGGCMLEIGGYGEATDPLIEDNQVNDTEVLVRSSDGVIYRNNVQNRGIFALGTTNAGDRPQNLAIGPGNTFNGPGTVKVNSGSTYTCDGNIWTGTWSKEGTLNCTNQPVP